MVAIFFSISVAITRCGCGLHYVGAFTRVFYSKRPAADSRVV